MQSDCAKYSLAENFSSKFDVTCLAMFWRQRCLASCRRHSLRGVTYPATAKIIARQVARKVGLDSTLGSATCLASILDVARYLTPRNFSCHLCRNVAAKTSREKLHEAFHGVRAIFNLPCCWRCEQRH